MNQTQPNCEVRLLRFRDAAKFLGVGASTLYEFVNRGTLKPVNLGGLRGLRFDLRDLEEFIEREKRTGNSETTDHVSYGQTQNPNRKRSMP